jgi:DGQHR domain-containing protein
MTSKSTLSVSLVTQGKHRFYTLTMPSEVLAATCTVDTREENPIEGFQRVLDEKRAQEIADYIDNGFGTIPTAIVLSAQPRAKLEYNRSRRSISFNVVAGAFLILDGQHRVFGFSKAETNLRVPVVIYNDLKRKDETRLFMDINTKQRPVPNELLLDIKRLAETETDQEEFLRGLFDRFNSDSASPLAGLLSPSKKQAGKLSRVSFNAALKLVFPTLGDAGEEKAYAVLSAYLSACMNGLRKRKQQKLIANPTLFRAIFMLFPSVAVRVSDKYGDYTIDNFDAVLDPVFSSVKSSKLSSPGSSPAALCDTMKVHMTQNFTIA